MAARKPASLFARAARRCGWRTRDGKAAAFADLSATRQSLDMWTGRLTSSFMFDGVPVEVETSVHPERDSSSCGCARRCCSTAGSASISSFPASSRKLNPDPADWEHPESHSTQEVARGAGGLTLDAPARRHALFGEARRRIASSTSQTPGAARVPPHRARLHAAHLASRVHRRARRRRSCPMPKPRATPSPSGGKSFWMHGGVVDFTGSKRSRAPTSSSGASCCRSTSRPSTAPARCRRRKRACSPIAGTASSTSRCMPGTRRISRCGAGRSCSSAACRGISTQLRGREGARQGARACSGAWWPKMVGPEGRESPSTVNPFIMWQQPHPIYLAETLYKRASRRARRWRNTASWCSRPRSCSRAGRSTTRRPSATCSGRR